ncbi:MAG TPA: carbamate kinase [Chloroflexi bacterium]|nr:MAG: carbamate kinase [Chloroflexota bacterium]HDN04339.1 carbamate kinase [Chloroflexota bacterium]
MTNDKKVAVVAIGGNSLIKSKQHQTVLDQYKAAQETSIHLVDMIEAGWDIAVGHGNGPQVGFILRRSEIAHKAEGMHEVPLDVCGADSQGAIGYSLQQTIYNELKKRGIDKTAATVITQVRVDANDPAFQAPAKPIGTFMEEDEAMQKKEELGWNVVEDAGRGWRRVVASPIPVEIMELDAIRALIDSGTITITVGGGGIPVIESEGGLIGTAAVIDKDFASAFLANEINADLLLISTAVEKVSLNFGKPDQVDLDQITVAEAKKYLDEGTHFAKGSMEPKIKAIVKFLEQGGKEAIVTNPENIGRALKGETGTRIVP